MSKVLGIVVARMGSSRIPGKCLLDLCGKPVIEHIIERVKKVAGIDEVLLATSDLKQDLPLVQVAEKCGIRSYLGDPDRVLDRVYGAMLFGKGDVVIEVGGDCPLIDPLILQDALIHFKRVGCDYLNNYDPPTFPEGMDVNILKSSAIEKAHQNAVAPSQRIHPFSYLTRHPKEFDIKNYERQKDELATYHWSLDFPDDIDFIRLVYSKLYQSGVVFHLEDILNLIKKNDHVEKLNKKITKPPVLHAFWNSPGIMKDMHTDIELLNRMALDWVQKKEFKRAQHCFEEMINITKELERHSAHETRHHLS